MPDVILVTVLPISIVLGLIVVWRVARKHNVFLAVGTGLFAVCAMYGILILRESHLIALSKQAGCWEWCDMGYILYGGMAVTAFALVLIGGSITAILVRRRTRVKEVEVVKWPL
jgi:hypothetical protein